MAGPRSRFLMVAAAFVAGVIVGGWLFSDTQRRSLLAVTECDHCLEPSEISGLVGSVLVQRASALLPQKVLETNRTLVIRHPMPQAPHHYLLLPKRDIKNVGALAPGDEPYVVDLMAAAGKLAREQKLRSYRLWTNGPGEQAVGYLHFHLTGR